MRIITTAFLFLVSYSLTAQSLDMVFRDSILNKRSLQINSINDLTSNSLNNSFLSKFVYGGEITDALIDANGQKKFNVFGGEAEQHISYFEGSFLPSQPFIGLVVSASDHNFVSSSFKPDIFNLAFRGNTPYLGDTLDFSYAHAQYLHYQNYSVGVYDKRTQSFVKLGFLVGNRSFNYRVGESMFHTSETQNDLYFMADLQGHHTASDSNTSYFTAQGYGFALELNHNFMINTRSGNRHVINFNLSNIGSIFWGRSTHSVNLDTTYQYTGYDYSNIENISNLDEEYLADSLGITTSRYARRESLPIQIIINKQPFFSLTQKWQSIFGFKALLIPDYRPMVFGGVYYQPNKYFSLSSRVLFGGYGGLRLGLNANLWLNDKFYMGIGTLNVIGTASNSNGRGKGANVSLQYNF